MSDLPEPQKPKYPVGSLVCWQWEHTTLTGRVKRVYRKTVYLEDISEKDDGYGEITEQAVLYDLTVELPLGMSRLKQDGLSEEDLFELEEA